MEKSKRQKRKEIIRACVAVVLVAIIVAAVAVVAKKTRISEYFEGGVKEGETFYYDASGNAAFGGVGANLAVLSTTDLTVYDKTGKAVFTEYCYVSSPAVTSAGNYAAAYDIGGHWLCFFGGEGVIKVFEIETPIVSATVSESGMLAICAQDSGYYGMTEIYNAAGEAVYRWRSGTAYVLTAEPDEAGFWAAALGKGGSKIVRYSYDSTEEQASFTTERLVIDLLPMENGIRAVTDEGIFMIAESGEVTAEYPLEGAVLDRYAGGDGFTVLFTGEYRTSTQRELTVINTAGEKTASVTAEDGVTDVSAAGNYVAVLYKDKAVLYSADFTEITKITELSGEKNILPARDGSFFVAGIYSAAGHAAPAE